jgi:hypothetical protein
MTNVGRGSQDATRNINQFSKSTDNVGKSAKGAQQATVGLGHGVQNAAGGFALAGSAALSLWNAYDNVGDASQKVEIATGRVATAERRLSTTREALTKLQQSGTASALDLEQAQLAVTAAEAGIVRSNLMLTNSQEALNEAWLNAATSIVPALFTGISGISSIMQAFGARTKATVGDTTAAATSIKALGTSATSTGAPMIQLATTSTQASTGVTTLSRSAISTGGPLTQLGVSSTTAATGVTRLNVAAATSATPLSRMATATTVASTSQKAMVASSAAAAGGAIAFGAAAGGAGTVGAGKFVTGVKGMGLAVKGFMLAMGPIGWIMIGLGAAVTAVATNFMGFRDGLNSAGKAIGDFIPFLRPALDGLTELGKMLGIVPDDAKDAAEGVDEFGEATGDTIVSVKTLGGELAKTSPLIQEAAKAWGLYGIETAKATQGQQQQLAYLQQLDADLKPARQGIIDLATANGVDLWTALNMTDEEMRYYSLGLAELGPTAEQAAAETARAAKQFADAWMSSFETIKEGQQEWASTMSQAADTVFEEMGREMELFAEEGDEFKTAVKGGFGFNDQFWEEIFPKHLAENAFRDSFNVEGLIHDVKGTLDKVTDAGLITDAEAREWFDPLMNFMEHELPRDTEEAFGYLVGRMPHMMEQLAPVIINGIHMAGGAARGALKTGLVDPFLAGLKGLETGMSGIDFGRGLIGMVNQIMPRLQADFPKIAGLMQQTMDNTSLTVDEKVQEIIAYLGQVSPAFADEIMAMDQDADGIADIVDDKILGPVEIMKIGILEAFKAIAESMEDTAWADRLQAAIDRVGGAAGPAAKNIGDLQKAFDEGTLASNPLSAALAGVRTELNSIIGKVPIVTGKVEGFTQAEWNALSPIQKVNEQLAAHQRALDAAGASAHAAKGKIDALMESARQAQISEDDAWFAKQDAAAGAAGGGTGAGVTAAAIPAPDDTAFKQKWTDLANWIVTKTGEINNQLNTWIGAIPGLIANIDWAAVGASFRALWERWILPTLDQAAANMVEWAGKVGEWIGHVDFNKVGEAFRGLWEVHILPILNQAAVHMVEWSGKIGEWIGNVDFAAVGTAFSALYTTHIGPWLANASTKIQEWQDHALQYFKDIDFHEVGAKWRELYTTHIAPALAGASETIRQWQDHAVKFLSELSWSDVQTKWNEITGVISGATATASEHIRGWRDNIVTFMGSWDWGKLQTAFNGVWNQMSGGLQTAKDNILGWIGEVKQAWDDFWAGITGQQPTPTAPPLPADKLAEMGGPPGAGLTQLQSYRVDPWRKGGDYTPPGGGGGVGAGAGTGGGVEAGKPPDFTQHKIEWNNYQVYVDEKVNEIGQHILRLTQGYGLMLTGTQTAITQMAVLWSGHAVAIGAQVDATGQHLLRLVQGYGLTLTGVQTAVTQMAVLWAGHATAVGGQVNAVGQHITRLVRGYGLLMTGVAQALSQGASNWSSHAGAVGGQVNAVGQHIIRLIQGYGGLMSGIQRALSAGTQSWNQHRGAVQQAASNAMSSISRLASAVSSGMSRIVSSMNTATSAAGRLRSAINSLQNKNITVTTRYRTIGSPGGGVQRAASGFSGVVTQPTRFMTGEGNRPELVQVTPLSPNASGGVRMNKSAAMAATTADLGKTFTQPTVRAGGSKVNSKRADAVIFGLDGGAYAYDTKGNVRSLDFKSAGETGNQFKWMADARARARKIKGLRDSEVTERTGSRDKPESEFRVGFRERTTDPLMRRGGLAVGRGGKSLMDLGVATSGGPSVRWVIAEKRYKDGSFARQYSDGSIEFGHDKYQTEEEMNKQIAKDKKKKKKSKYLHEDTVADWVGDYGYKLSSYDPLSDGRIRLKITAGKNSRRLHEDTAARFVGGYGYSLSSYDPGSGGKINMTVKSKNARHGFEGLVTKPTQFLAGEGGKAERVSVQPLNESGSGGGRNFKGGGGGRPIIVEQHIVLKVGEREIASALRKELLGGIYSMT